MVRNVETRGDRGIVEAASWLGLSDAKVRIAVEYYADYPAEIDAWLAKVDAQAVEAEELSRRRQGEPGRPQPGARASATPGARKGPVPMSARPDGSGS